MAHQLNECYKGGSLDGRPGWVLRFQYEAEVVEELKNATPHYNREWREETKEWWVSEDYAEELETLFGNFHALAFLQGKLF